MAHATVPKYRELRQPNRDGVNGFGNRFGTDDRPGSPFPPPGSIPDVNTYQQKKNLAQGMMDLALLSANANQMRYVLESSTSHPYFYPSLVFISLNVIFQIAVGVGLIMNSRYDVKDEKEICKADKINNMTVLGIFLITIVNVFITSFSVATPTAVSAVGAAVVQQAG
ncbi:Ninjurin-1 [Papilio machaon]|uniref:Ninjurin-1 n=1 Tax=Papilio machaon TaxID=76193 RepID=A0A194RIX7_PAPMA|nr:Ninjurin-1 [Papilio machaon]